MVFLVELGLSQFLGAILGIIIGIMVISLLLYIYSSLAIMAIAKRTDTPNPWLAWIPYANLYLVAEIAQNPWWPILLVLVPAIAGFLQGGIIISIISALSMITFVIFNIIWWWRICEKRNKPGWWVLIGLIPILGWIWGLILIGILAWGKDDDSSTLETSMPLTQKLNN